MPLGSLLLVLVLSFETFFPVSLPRFVLGEACPGVPAAGHSLGQLRVHGRVFHRPLGDSHAKGGRLHLASLQVYILTWHFFMRFLAKRKS